LFRIVAAGFSSGRLDVFVSCFWFRVSCLSVCLPSLVLPFLTSKVPASMMVTTADNTTNPLPDVTPAVVMSSITKRFPGVLANDEVTFEVRREWSGQINPL
jgi:hypothetical protein